MDYYIGVSESFREMLIARNFDPDRIMTVYNGINIEEIESKEIDEDFFKKYGIIFNDNIVKVGILARLHPVKGVNLFIKAAHKVLQENRMLNFL